MLSQAVQSSHWMNVAQNLTKVHFWVRFAWLSWIIQGIHSNSYRICNQHNVYKEDTVNFLCTCIHRFIHHHQFLVLWSSNKLRNMNVETHKSRLTLRKSINTQMVIIYNLLFIHTLIEEENFIKSQYLITNN